MAMGSRGRSEAENAIGSCRPFRNSTGSMKGTKGSTRALGWLESHTEARRIRELLSRAVYVVWSYNTPIAFVSETEDGDRQAYYVDESHSPTTTNHQCIARMGLGEYETIGDGHRDRRPRRTPVTAGQMRTEVERDHASWVARQRALDTRDGLPELAALAGSPGYQNGLNEESQEARMRRLLDPRYANPDWVPGRNIEADRAAELRDAARIERTMDQGWTP